MHHHFSIKNNLLNLWQKLAQDSGWKTLEKDALLCLKPPIKFPWLNMSWGIITQEELQIVQKFFKDKSFCLMIEQNARVNFDLLQKFFDPELETEMHINLSHSQNFTQPPHITFKKVSTLRDFKLFVQTSSTIFSIPHDDMYKFMHPIRTHSCAFLAFIKKECVGTAQFYLDDYGFAGLQTIGVLEPYRQRGIAKALTQLCLSIAQKSGAKSAGLSASEQGVKLYGHLQFSPVKYWKIQISRLRIFEP